MAIAKDKEMMMGMMGKGDWKKSSIKKEIRISAERIAILIELRKINFFLTLLSSGEINLVFNQSFQ
jgi:hypothetical protein